MIAILVATFSSSLTEVFGWMWLLPLSGQNSAREGQEVAWEFAGSGGDYTGRMLVDGEIYTPSEATKKFLQGERE